MITPFHESFKGNGYNNYYFIDAKTFCRMFPYESKLNCETTSNLIFKKCLSISFYYSSFEDIGFSFVLTGTLAFLTVLSFHFRFPPRSRKYKRLFHLIYFIIQKKTFRSFSLTLYVPSFHPFFPPTNARTFNSQAICSHCCRESFVSHFIPFRRVYYDFTYIIFTLVEFVEGNNTFTF